MPLRDINLFHHVQNAIESLLAHRLRTILTMLGVTIGIASVTAILSITRGASELIAGQIQNLQGNIAVLRSGAQSQNQAETFSSTQTNYAAATLTEDDVQSLKKISEIESVAPLASIRTTIKSGSNGNPNTAYSVVGTTPELAKINNLTLREGQFMDEGSNASTVVLGEQLAINLFGTEHAIGKVLQLHGKNFTVIGVLKKTNQPVNFSNIDFDNAAMMSTQALKEFTQNVTQIQQINIKSQNPEKLASAIKQADAAILKNHQDERDFSVLTGEDISRPTSQLFHTISLVATIIASISLIVGGIGIMNILLVNVAERTREIGIRKAVGASNSHIMWQFIIESIVISLCGGIAGYLIGMVAAVILSFSLPFAPSFSFNVPIISLALALVVGIAFGIYPAIKAARKDPIESLRRPF